MQRFITDERTGIRYELIGDYYYPCLIAEEMQFMNCLMREQKRCCWLMMLITKIF